MYCKILYNTCASATKTPTTSHEENHHRTSPNHRPSEPLWSGVVFIIHCPPVSLYQWRSTIYWHWFCKVHCSTWRISIALTSTRNSNTLIFEHEYRSWRSSECFLTIKYIISIYYKHSSTFYFGKITNLIVEINEKQTFELFIVLPSQSFSKNE